MHWTIFKGFWTVKDTLKHDDSLFIFGDNDLHFGQGGQAIIRYRVNSIGIPTKKAPDNNIKSFYTDAEYSENCKKIDCAIQYIKMLLQSGLYSNVMYPENGIGTGLAQLDKKAPKTFEYLNQCIQELKKYVESLSL